MCDNQQPPHLDERLERIMPDFPSGTVRLLFTGIEGSTRLWERDRQVIAAAVDRHLALLDTAIASHRGEPVGPCH